MCELKATPQKRNLVVARPQGTCVERLGLVLFRAACGAVATSHSAENSRRGLFNKMVDRADFAESKLARQIDLYQTR